MTNNRLNIVAVENNKVSSSPTSAVKRRRDEAKEKYDLLWKTDPKQFNPLRNTMERERIARTMELILQCLPLDPAPHVVDLGCGQGVITQRLAEQKAHVHAVDIASRALEAVQMDQNKNITTSQDYVPRTLLKDTAYDIVVSTELIGYLPADEYRLYVSEMARIMKANGHVICSTRIDIHSIDALQRFSDLLETEFEIEKWVISYHAYYIKLKKVLMAPSRYVCASQDVEYRTAELKRRQGFSKRWFNINTGSFMAFFWRGIKWCLNPIVNFIQQNRTFLLNLEKICKIISNESGISHAIALGIRRPLTVAPNPEKAPVERKEKKQVWE